MKIPTTKLHARELMKIPTIDLLNHLQKHKWDSDDQLNIFTASKLAAAGCSQFDINYLFGLQYLYLFSPCYDLCSSLVFNNEETIMKCCIMYRYNRIYFDQMAGRYTFSSSFNFNYDYYFIAAKTNNIEVYNHQHSLKPDDIPSLELDFDYSLYIT